MKLHYFLLWGVWLSCSCDNIHRDKAQNHTQHPTENHLVNSDSTLATNSEDELLDFNTEHTFEKYKVRVFKGRLSPPNFKNNPFADDPEYVQFITDGCKKSGVNFAGRYSAFTRSCGCGCLHICIVDRITGEIFVEINPNDGRYGYEFRPNSALLLANAYLFVDEDFKKYENDPIWTPELYLWKGNAFERIQ